MRYYYKNGKRTGYSMGGGEWILMFLIKFFGVMLFYLWPAILPHPANIVVFPIWLIITISLTVLYFARKSPKRTK